MADVTPNYLVEQQRLKSQIAAQRSQIEGQTLAILEMVDRKQRHIVNINAAKKAIEEFEHNLRALEEAHGALTAEQIEAAQHSLGEITNG